MEALGACAISSSLPVPIRDTNTTFFFFFLFFLSILEGTQADLFVTIKGHIQALIQMAHRLP